MMKTSLCINLFFVVLSILFYGTPVTAQVDGEAIQKLANANNEFSMKLHRSLADNSLRNIIFSPTSLFFALGTLYKGARGQTAQDLRKFLGYDEAGLSDEEVDHSFNLIYTQTWNDSDKFSLKTANTILVDHRYILNPEYKQSVQDFYQTSIQSVDFHRDMNQLVRTINQWINDQTEGKIPNFLEDLDPSTVMTILNAIYFKGFWSIPFEISRTTKERFYNYGKDTKSKVVPMMHTSHRILYTFTPEWQMIELPYKGDRISMVIVLPRERDGLEAVEKSLTPEQIREYRSKMRPSTIKLTFPKFKIDSSIDLNPHLRSLGLRNVFGNGADFSGMVPNQRIRVSQVMQKTVVEVNEEGTIAAAASGVYLVPLSLSVPREFKVDHPFFFAIVGKKTNLILFSGRVIAL